MTTVLKALPFILLAIVMVLISLGIGLFALDFKSMAWPDVLTNNMRALAYITMAIATGFGYAILVFQFLQAFITTESHWGILGRRVAQFGLNRVSLDAIDLNSLTQDRIAPAITSQIDASLQGRLITSSGPIMGLFVVHIVLLVAISASI